MREFLKSTKLLIIGLAFASAMPTAAQEKTAVKPNFVLPADARIIIFRPSIKVGAQSTGGMFEPNADWTEEAKSQLAKALQAAAATKIARPIVAYPESVGAQATTLADYQSLFSAVASAVLEFKLFPGNRLPSKKNSDLDYTLGPGVSALSTSDKDYGLFFLTEDQYGSTGRKVLQFMAAGLLGVGVSSGVHKGYAGLVDLQTGDLVWINADAAMGGDVRTADGAAKRVAQLLEDLPTTPAAPKL